MTRALGACVALVGLLSGSMAHAGEGGPKKYGSQIANLEAAADRLVREFANPLAIVRKFPNQRRLIDARVFYELGQFENAAMLLIDVMERPDFQGDLEYDATELLLGECLLKIDNPRAAHDHFLRVAQGSRDPILAEEARLNLLESALTDGSPETIKTAISELGQNVSSDRTRYGLGKAYIRLDEPDNAITWLQVIPPQSELYTKARFYIGAAYSAKGQYDLALEVFRNLTQVKGDEPDMQELRDQAWLAVARLLVQRGNIELALTSYQNIGRHSVHYEEALYEMSWAYINQEKYDKALQTVEVLLLTVSDPQVDIDAHVLRGQLNVMLNDYDEALASYQTIVDRFAPIRNELARFTKNPDDVQKYFKWLLARKGELGALQSPLSVETVKWLESTADFSRVAGVFDRIAGEREDIKTAHAIGVELEQILSAKNRVEMFPDLRDGWSQALVLENRLVLLAGEMLDQQSASVEGRLAGGDVQEHKELVEYRRHLEEQASALPKTFEAYEKRQADVSIRYRELERKNFFVEQGLADVQRQLIAVEKFLNQKQYADTPQNEKLSPERETGLRTDIEAEKAELQGMYDELTGLKREIQLALKSVGTGDEASQGEQGLKAQLLQALAHEGQFYDRVGARLGGTLSKDFGQYSDLRSRIALAVTNLDGVIGAIDREVGTKTGELVDLVRHEIENLEAYNVDVQGFDRDGRQIASRLGDEFFKRAAVRMDRVVLEADVGLLDVMWARKQDKTAELGRLSDERNKRLKQLTQDLESIKEGAANESAEKKQVEDDEATPPGTPLEEKTP
ncbi:MAG: tetratricopeptide repeat protein [Myxococcota bacterium]